MALYNFVDQVGPVVDSAWLNPVDYIRNVVTVPSTIDSLGISVASTISNTLAVTGVTTLSSAGNGGLTASLVLSSARPQLNFVETDAAANTGRWMVDVNGGVLTGAVLSDAGVASNFLTVQRSTSSAVSVTFPVSAIGTSSFVTAGQQSFRASAALPIICMNETDAAANNRYWDMALVSESLQFRVGNDAESAFVTWMSVERTANVVDSIFTVGSVFRHTGNTSAIVVTNGATANDDAYFRMDKAGTTFALMGVAGQANGLATGSAAGSTVIRAQSQSINFSVDGGTTICARVASNTQVQCSVGSAANPSICATTDGDSGLNLSGSNVVSLVTNSNDRVVCASGGNVYFPGIGTTASAANAFLNSGSSPANELLRSTSSIRYKTDVVDLDSGEARKILELRPITYKSLCQGDAKDLRWYGLLAEDVAKVLPRLVHYTKDEKGEEIPDGVQYERLNVLLLAVVRQQREMLAKMEARIAALEAKG